MRALIQRTLVWSLAAIPAAAATVGAQAIRGVVVDAADRPVSGVVVVLVDSASAVVGRALSSADGVFRVAAARGGSYRLRTLRIGYRPTTSDPIALTLGREVTRRIALDGALVALDTVRVVDRRSCRVANDASAAATFAVLEQARTALSAAQLTLAGRVISATTTAYDRTLDADGRRIVRQSSRTSTQYVAQPWRALSPDSAHRAGFVFVDRDNTTTYSAPSIDVLLSDSFIEDHCFRLVADRKQPDVVGVAFEPSNDRRKIPEIQGTLWVDRRSAELRRLEYRYVHISDAQENASAGGETAFARLKNGGWVISRWRIRMPVLEQLIRSSALGGSRLEVAAIQEVGGEVELATQSSAGRLDTLWTRPPRELSGTVVDSAGGKPIAGARIDLVGAPAADTTDARGRFAIPGVLPGTYLVETRTPALEAIGAAYQSTIAFDDSTASYQIRVPTPAQLIAALCSGRALDSRETVIVGRVTARGDTAGAAGARVVAEWTDLALREERGVAVDRTGRRLEGRTSSDGSYRLCGVPAVTHLTVTASTPALESAPTPLFSSTRVARIDLRLSRAVRPTATFAGTVFVDSTTTPIDGAEIYFPELSKVGRSTSGGAFRVDDIPPGEQHVVVRRVGYGALDTRLTFVANTELQRRIFLSRATVLDSVVVTDRLTDRMLADFEDNRRLGLGHFMDRAELAAQRDVKLSRLVAQWPGIQLAFGTGGRVWVTGTRKGPPPCRPGDASCFAGHGYYVPDAADAQLGVKMACYSQVYLDGTLMNHGNPTKPFEASSLIADQIEAIEWYAGPSETPARYANLNSPCGVLVVHTRRTP